MSVDFDFSEFLAFANNFHDQTERDIDFIKDVMNQLGNLMIREVKQKTPVGQYDGTVFFVRGGKLLVFEGGGTARTGGNLRRNWTLDGVQSTGDGYVVTISNNTEYAGFVENGHRKVGGGWVEGQFFLKITMEEIMDQLPAIVGPAYRDYLTKFGFD